MTVLIVDDEPDIRIVIRLALQRTAGVRVLESADGDAGIALARAERPDVVLLDVTMPGADGPAVLAALRSDPATAGIPVVFLTANAMGRDLERLTTLGAAAVLTKPFDPDALVQTLRAAAAR